MAGRRFYRYASGQNRAASQSISVDRNLLMDGDSWMVWNSGMLSYLTGITDNGSTTNYLSGKRLLNGTVGIGYRLNQFLNLAPAATDPQAPNNVRLAAYNGIVFDGSGNDFVSAPTTVSVSALKVALIDALDRCLDETHNVLYISTAPMAGQVFPAAWGQAWQDGFDFDGRDLNAMRDDFDDWAEAYCAAVGVKFIHTNNEMAGGTGVLDSAYYTGDPGHIDAAGSAYLGGLISALIRTDAIYRTDAMTAVLNRPNRELLTAADMAAIKAVIDGLGSEWSKVNANGDYWLFKQSDVSAGGNALTGLKNGLVMDIREWVSGLTTNPSAITATAGGASFASNRIGILSFSPNACGRTAGFGVVNKASGSSGVDTLKRYVFGADTNIFTSFTALKLHGLAGTDSMKIAHGSGEVEIAADFDPGSLGNCWEIKSVANGSNNDLTLFDSGVAVAAPTSAASQGLATVPIIFNGLNDGGTSYLGFAYVYEYSVFYVTDGTNDAALWASVAEAV